MTTGDIFSFPFRKFLVTEHRRPGEPFVCLQGGAGRAPRRPGVGGVDWGHWNREEGGEENQSLSPGGSGEKGCSGPPPWEGGTGEAVRSFGSRWGRGSTPEQASWLARGPVHLQVLNASGFPASGNEDGVRANNGRLCASHSPPQIFRDTKNCFLARGPTFADGAKQMQFPLVQGSSARWGLSITSSCCLFFPQWRLPEGKGGVPLSSVST